MIYKVIRNKKEWLAHRKERAKSLIRGESIGPLSVPTDYPFIAVSTLELGDMGKVSIFYLFIRKSELEEISKLL